MPIYDNIYLVRPRVNRLLERAAQQSFVSVCAGAGYGKTQAVQAFCRQSGGKIIWLQLFPPDNDERRFWEKMVHSLFPNSPVEAELRLRGMPKTALELERYFAALTDAFDSWPQYSRIYTVYDDLHVIENPDILRFIRETVRFMTPKRTIFILSQALPFPELTGPMARESAPLISEEDLLFTEEEVADYLRLLGVSVSVQNVRRVFEGTRGWALALGIAGQTLQRSKEPWDGIVDAMQVNIDKLMGVQIREGVSARLKDLLFRLSLLDHLPAQLVRTLAGGDEGLIAELEKCSAYVRYDIYMNMYVIHDFFRDYLRRFQDSLSEEEKQAVYREAGDWCAKNGYILYAVNNYEKAQAYGALVQLVYGSVNRQVPPDVAARILTVLEKAPPETAGDIRLFPLLHLRLLLSLGRLSETLQQARAYEKWALEQPEGPEMARVIAEVYYNMGVACQLMATTTDRYDFYRYFQRQDLYYSKYPYTFKNVWQPSLFVGFWVTCVGASRAGALEEYVESLEKSSIALLHARGGYGAGKAAAAKGEVCFYQGKFKEADQYFQRAVREAGEQSQYSLILCALFYRMRICFFRGDAAETGRVLQSMKELLAEDTYLARYTTYDIAVGLYYLHVGQPQMVPDWLKGDFSAYTHPKFIENAGNQLKAYYRFQTGDYTPLQAFMVEKGKRETILFERLEMQAMEACVLYLKKEKDAAFAKLREAYETSAPNGLIVPFTEFGRDMRTLTASALRSGADGIPREWLELVNRQASSYAKRRAAMTADFNASNRLETAVYLSRREREVLTELSRGLTRAQIAAKLGISANTVKLTANNLYSKMGANNAADAIRIGLDRKLI